MGLELTELLMRVEDQFHIDIDDDANHIQTVGELHAYVLNKLNPYADHRAQELARRHRIQQIEELLAAGFSEVFDIPVEAIRESADLNRLLPRWGRKRRINRVGRETALTLPDLEYSDWPLLPSVVLTITLSAVLAIYVGVSLRPFSSSVSAVAVPVALLSGLVVFGALFTWASHLFGRLPARFSTLSGLAEWVYCASPVYAPTYLSAPPAQPRQACLTPRAFFRVRRVLMDLFGQPKDKIRPNVMLSELFPSAARKRRSWRLLHGALDISAPSLVLGPKTARSLQAIGLFLGLAAFVVCWWHIETPLRFWLAGAITLTGWSLLWICSRPFAYETPEGWTTVGDLARGYVRQKFLELRPSNRPPNSDEVWDMIKEAVATSFDVREEAVHYTTRFIEDLGA